MLSVIFDDERLIEKHFFAFVKRYSMSNPILVEIGVIPVEAGNSRKLKLIHVYL